MGVQPQKRISDHFNGKTQTENKFRCSKPLKFYVTWVESCLELGGGGYSQNSENCQDDHNGKKKWPNMKNANNY